MKTKNLFKTCPGFVVLALAFCLNSCTPDDLIPGESVPEGLSVKSVDFYFTDPSGGKLECMYGYCDNDGCCTTPAEKVDTFRLKSNQVYNCSLELNQQNPAEFFNSNREKANQYSFSIIPRDGVDLTVDYPETEYLSHSAMISRWTTGQSGTGTVNFKIRFCPYNFVEGPCYEYEISLPVVIE